MLDAIFILLVQVETDIKLRSKRTLNSGGNRREVEAETDIKRNGNEQGDLTAALHAFRVTVGSGVITVLHTATGAVELLCGDDLTVFVGDDGALSVPIRPTALSNVSVTHAE